MTFQVPNEKKFKRESKNVNLKDELHKIVNNVSEALKTKFIHSFAIEDIDDPYASDKKGEDFQRKIESIRTIICQTKNAFLNSQVRTWSQVISYYNEQISEIEKDKSVRKAAIKNEIENEIDKIKKIRKDMV